MIRVLPEKDGSKEVELYYEMIEFSQNSKVNYLEFTEPGCFKQIQKLMGKAPNEGWTEEEASLFKTAFYNLKKAFHELNGESVNITASDAMLTYLKIFGYQDLISKSNEQLKKSLLKIWEEVCLLEERENIDLKEGPQIIGEKRKQKFFKKLFGESGGEKQKVAFIYDKNPVTSGWVYGHELGRLYTQKIFDGVVTTRAYDDAMDKGAENVIMKAVEDGNKIIFTTSAKLLQAALSVAVEHPEITIFNCSLNKPHRSISTYYARMYEVKFLIGIIAGVMAGEDKVGYLGDYPIYGQIAGVNAFALGVQMVNPRAKVYLDWSCIDGAAAAEQRLLDQGVHIVSSQDLKKTAIDERTAFGLYEYKEGKKENLAMPLWNWGVYYEKLIRSIMDKSFQSEKESSRKAFNYYWGMSAGVVELICSKRVPESVKKLAGVLQDSICEGTFKPFQGKISTQEGKVLEGADGSFTLQQIIDIDWLAENIIGEIPHYETLSEEGKETVKSAGAPNTEAGEIR